MIRNSKANWIGATFFFVCSWQAMQLCAVVFVFLYVLNRIINITAMMREKKPSSRSSSSNKNNTKNPILNKIKGNALAHTYTQITLPHTVDHVLHSHRTMPSCTKPWKTILSKFIYQLCSFYDWMSERCVCLYVRVPDSIAMYICNCTMCEWNWAI